MKRVLTWLMIWNPLHAVNEGVFELNFTMKSSSYSRCPDEVHFHCASFLFWTSLPWWSSFPLHLWTSLPRWSSFQLHLFLVLNFIAPMKFILRALLPNFELITPMKFIPRALLPNFELHAYTQWSSFHLPPDNKKPPHSIIMNTVVYYLKTSN